MTIYTRGIIGLQLNADSDFTEEVVEFCIECIEQITDTPDCLLKFKKLPELCELLTEAVRSGKRCPYVSVSVQGGKPADVLETEVGVAEGFESFYDELYSNWKHFDDVVVELSFI